VDGGGWVDVVMRVVVLAVGEGSEGWRRRRRRRHKHVKVIELIFYTELRPRALAGVFEMVGGVLGNHR
jgi:uncharacterized alpha-E superfamily protein